MVKRNLLPNNDDSSSEEDEIEEDIDADSEGSEESKHSKLYSDISLPKDGEYLGVKGLLYRKRK